MYNWNINKMWWNYYRYDIKDRGRQKLEKVRNLGKVRRWRLKPLIELSLRELKMRNLYKKL